jgi:hypothetical protein
MINELHVMWYIRKLHGGIVCGPGHIMDQDTGKPKCKARCSDNIAWQDNILAPDAVTCKRCQRLLEGEAAE